MKRIRTALHPHRVTLILIVSIAVLSLFGTALGETSSPQGRANELLDRARAAIRIESSESKAEALVVAGEFTSIGTARRFQTVSMIVTPRDAGKTIHITPMEPADDVGNFRFALQPDKIKQEFSYWTPDGQPAFIRTLCRDGEDVRSENRVAGGSQGPIGSRTSISVTPAEAPDAAVRRNLKAASALYQLVFLLQIDPSFPISFTYAGQAETPNGLADVLDGKGPEGIALKLFLDEKTHRPMKVTYEMPSFAGTREIKMTDYRDDSGSYFPHLISRSTDGKLKLQFRIGKVAMGKVAMNGRIGSQEFCK
jgi:hypothetical protein